MIGLRLEKSTMFVSVAEPTVRFGKTIEPAPGPEARYACWVKFPPPRISVFEAPPVAAGGENVTPPA